MIKKVEGGWVILHCAKGSNKYTRISATKNPVSYQKALSIHRAIMAQKYKKK